MSMFKKAETKSIKLTLGLLGPAGAGKTMTALRVARGLVGVNGRIAIIDTEGGKANLYANQVIGGYDLCEMKSPYTFEKLNEYLTGAVQAGYDVVILDSLSHFWTGAGGALEQVDEIATMNNGFSPAGWKVVTPKMEKLMERFKTFPCHIIVTVRSKMQYEVSKEPGQKAKVTKLGLQPIWRGDTLEYDMDNIMTITTEHKAWVSKTRLHGIADRVFDKPGEDVGMLLRNILESGNFDSAAINKVVEPVTPDPIPADEESPEVTEKQKLLTKLEDLAIKTNRDCEVWFPTLAKHFGKEDIAHVPNTKLKDVVAKITKDLGV